MQRQWQSQCWIDISSKAVLICSHTDFCCCKPIQMKQLHSISASRLSRLTHKTLPGNGKAHQL
eukprot:6486816-Amphidinium_carterae.1